MLFTWPSGWRAEQKAPATTCNPVSPASTSASRFMPSKYSSAKLNALSSIWSSPWRVHVMIIASSFQGQHGVLTIFSLLATAPIAGSSRESQADLSCFHLRLAWQRDAFSRGWRGLHTMPLKQLPWFRYHRRQRFNSFLLQTQSTVVTPNPDITAWTLFKLSTRQG